MSGRPPNHFTPDEPFLTLLDGLLLGDGRLGRLSLGGAPHFSMTQMPRRAGWVEQVQAQLEVQGLICRRETLRAQPGMRGEALSLRTRVYAELVPEHDRWYCWDPVRRRFQKHVPTDVRLTPCALAHWYFGDGSQTWNGYAVRFATHGFTESEVRFLADRLAALYGWQPEVVRDEHTGRNRPYWFLRLARSDDRCALRDLITPFAHPCMAYKLRIRASRPCSEAEAARRRNPRRLTPAEVAMIRERAATDESYTAIAADLDVNPRTIGKVARGERANGGEPLRRRGPTVRLNEAQVAEILRRLATGETQGMIAAAVGTTQPRVSRLKRQEGDGKVSSMTRSDPLSVHDRPARGPLGTRTSRSR